MADSESLTMMALGDYRFSLNTAAYQELHRSSSWRWPTVDRLGAMPAAQYVGPGEDTIHLPGVIFPHFRGGLGQVDAMRAEATKGKPLILVDGQGVIWGHWCITSIEETRSVFFSNGMPRRIEFELALLNYGDFSKAGKTTQGAG
jgi:phage protein U